MKYVKFVYISFIVIVFGCSNSGSSNDQSGARERSDGANYEDACTDSQKVAGDCLYTLKLEHNPELNRCIKDYAHFSRLHRVEGFTLLECDTSEYSITSLNGIQLLFDLQELNLSSGGDVNGLLENIDSIANMPKLTKIQLNGNNINQIPDLSMLVNLTYLSLANNNIADASTLSGLSKLQVVDLSNNNLSDSEPLMSIPGLTNINVFNNSNLNCSDLDLLAESVDTVSKPHHCDCIIGESFIGDCRI